MEDSSQDDRQIKALFTIYNLIDSNDIGILVNWTIDHGGGPEALAKLLFETIHGKMYDEIETTVKSMCEQTNKMEDYDRFVKEYNLLLQVKNLGNDFNSVAVRPLIS